MITALELFSAYAEVFLYQHWDVISEKPFLCLRRGVSGVLPVAPPPGLFSLPTQRCFRVKEEVKTTGALFSAYAEVFLWIESLCAPGVPFLCLRRGVSISEGAEALEGNFSLPTQRCFSEDYGSSRISFSLPTQRCFPDDVREVYDDALFSAYAEVFPSDAHTRQYSETFLCLRRGVSGSQSEKDFLIPFSLPTQRCFLFTRKVNERRRLFSAYAEVFLMRRKAQRLNGSFLCLRRGVSDTRERRGLHLIFSLPTQRCFPREQPGRNARDLFSAYAEVFLPGIGKAIG